MKKRMVLGILAVILLFLSVIFSIETPYNRALGDKILIGSGLKAWSNGYTGFHYTIIYALVIFIIGIKVTNLVFREKYPNFTKKLPVILLIFVISYPIIVSSSIKVIKYNSKTLDAVHYFKNESYIGHESNSNNEFATLNGTFKFRNYSKNDQEFYIKYFIPEFFEDEFSEKEVIALKEGTNEYELFHLPVKSTITIEAVFKVRRNENVSGSGHSKLVDISIFNEKEEIMFMENVIWGVTISD